MPDIIDITAEPIEDHPNGLENELVEQATFSPPELIDAAELAIAVVAACGRTPQGNMCARPMAPPELLTADSQTIRDAIRSTLPPKWLELLPNLDSELNLITDDQARMLLVLNSCFWCMGRIEGTLEERARHESTE